MLRLLIAMTSVAHLTAQRPGTLMIAVNGPPSSGLYVYDQDYCLHAVATACSVQWRAVASDASYIYAAAADNIYRISFPTTAAASRCVFACKGFFGCVRLSIMISTARQLPRVSRRRRPMPGQPGVQCIHCSGATYSCTICSCSSITSQPLLTSGSRDISRVAVDGNNSLLYFSVSCSIGWVPGACTRIGLRSTV